MAEVPRHPEIHDVVDERTDAKGRSPGIVIGVSVAAVVVLVIVLHLTGVIQPPSH